MLKKLFSGQINSITVAAALVATSSFISRFLGIFRDRILASEFGAGDILDVYYASFRIPDLVFNLLVLGAVSAGFIPVISCLVKDPRCRLKTLFHMSPNKEAWLFASGILNTILLALAVLCALGFAFAPILAGVIAPGFGPEKQLLTARLMRVMFLSPVLFGISSVLGGVLQSFKRFFVYSLSPILYNVGIIIGALFFVPAMGVYGLAWGVVLGAFLHMAIQAPVVYQLGFRYKFVLGWANRNVRELFKMMIPRTMSLGISQLNLLVITILASTLAGGSLAVFNLANNLQSFPVGIFGISFAVAAFPTLSTVAFHKHRLVYNFSHVFRRILFFVVPSTVLMLTLRAQIIRVILGAGEFNWTDTVMTIDTLGFFTISLFAQASIPLFIRVFYARHNAKTPFYIGLASALANFVFSLYFSRIYGVAGLALAFSLANIINFILLWIILRVELGSMDETRVLVSAVKFSIAALGAGTMVQGLKLIIAGYVNMNTFLGIFAQGIIAGLGGIAVYLAFCSFLKSEEFFDFWNMIKRKLPWKKVNLGDQGEARGI